MAVWALGINHNTETIRFSGVVDPLFVQAGNVVQSTQVADARLEYRGKGYIDEFSADFVNGEIFRLFDVKN